MLGDKAYDTQPILSYIAKEGASRTIPVKSNARKIWPVDWNLYMEGRMMECFFQKLKWFRRIATRYNKQDQSFPAFVYLALIMILVQGSCGSIFQNKALCLIFYSSNIISMEVIING